MDLVTVIVPTLNSERVLDSCIRSILSQTYHRIEVIIVDGGSTDQTLKIASRYQVAIKKTDHPSRGYQRNIGALSAKGNWLLHIDSDEILHPKLVESCLELALRQHVEGVLVSTIDTGQTYFGKARCLGDILNIRLKSDPNIPNSVLRFCSKKFYHSTGGYNEKLVIGEDSILKEKFLKQTKRPLRCEYSILHFGSEQLCTIFVKKYMYGKNFLIYNAAAKKIDLDVSGAFVSVGIFYLKNLFKYPDYACRYVFGFIIVKIIEAAGLVSGTIVSIV